MCWTFQTLNWWSRVRTGFISDDVKVYCHYSSASQIHQEARLTESTICGFSSLLLFQHNPTPTRHLTAAWSRALCISFQYSWSHSTTAYCPSGETSCDDSKQGQENIFLLCWVLNNMDHVRRSEKRRGINAWLPSLGLVFKSNLET